MLYAREHAATKASAQLIGYHLKALGPFWGGKLLSDVGAKACRDYVKHRADRVKPATARRELETLNAAIRYCAREHKTPLALLSFPERGEARDRWLTRSEAARLLLAAWRAGNRHLARFILIGLYSGTRHDAILRLQWHANTAGGWFDIDHGVMHRAGVGQRQTKRLKRQPSVRIQRRLIPHLERWRRLDGVEARHVVHWHGEAIAKERRAWHRAVAYAGLGADVTPHTLRHTCATWMMQRRVPRWEVAGYLGMSEKMLDTVYGHHSPDHQLAAATAF